MAKSVAIVGASSDRRKFGNKAVRAFLQKGWTVHPVHPRESRIEGLGVYASLADVPEPLEVISVYVPPAVGMKLLSEINAKRAGEVFFNPGSESAEVMRAAAELQMEPRYACSVTHIGLSPESFSGE